MVVTTSLKALESATMSLMVVVKLQILLDYGQSGPDEVTPAETNCPSSVGPQQRSRLGPNQCRPVLAFLDLGASSQPGTDVFPSVALTCRS